MSEKILEFFKTDTLLYFANPNDEACLNSQQNEQWKPVINWANKNYNLHLTPSQNLIENPEIPNNSMHIVRRWLLSNNFPALIAIQV